MNLPSSEIYKMPQKWVLGILDQNREAGQERCGVIPEIEVALFCCLKVESSGLPLAQ